MSKHKHDIRSLLIILGLLLAIWGLYKAGHEAFIPAADITPVAIDKGRATHPYPQPSIPELYSLTNQERVKVGLQPLALDDRLTASATAKCQDMVAKHYWQHIAPDGTRWDSFIDAQFSTYQAAGENLSEGYTTSETITQAWMHSPEHRANLLDRRYTLVGYAICNSTEYKDIVVQHLISL